MADLRVIDINDPNAGAGDGILRYGNVIGIFPSDARFNVEIRRAEDLGGSPNVATIVSLDNAIRPTERTYVDFLSPGSGPFHYATRHVPGGPWSCWRGPVEPVALSGTETVNPVMPRPREQTASTASLGTLTLVVDDIQCRLVQVRMKSRVGTAAESAYVVVTLGAVTAGAYVGTVALVNGVGSTITYELTLYNENGTLSVTEHVVYFSTGMSGDNTFLTADDERADLPSSLRVTSADASVTITRDETAGTFDLSANSDVVGGGSGSGTPGDGLIPFIVGSRDEPYVLGKHGSAVEVVRAGRVRRNVRKSAFIQGQADVVVAGAGTAWLGIGWSTTNDDTLAGTFDLQVPLKTAQPAVSFSFEVPADLGDVLLVPIMGGGDDDACPEVANFLVTLTAVAPPPTEGEGGPDEPPSPPDELPEDTTYGDVILDLNSGTEDDFADGARSDDWTDDSATATDGEPFTFGGTNVRGGPEYHASGFAGGDQPFMRLKPSDYGFTVPNVIGGDETIYVYGVFVSGGGVGNVGGNEAAHIIGMATGLSGENSWLRLQADGTLYFIGGASFFGSASASGTKVLTDGAPHIIRLVHFQSGGSVQVWVDGELDLDTGAYAGLVNAWSNRIYVGPGSTDSNKLTADISRIVRYNKAHTVDEDGLNVPEQVVTVGGLLGTGTGGGGGGGGGSVGGFALVGFGTETPAGRAGTVYRVTNLNDTGPGSLRDACSRMGERTIVFEVSGTINLTSKIAINSPFVTIAGQTAPSPGIMLKGHGISVRTHDVLVQHIRARVGGYTGADTNEDCFECIGASFVVWDHCSGSWSTDENASTWYSGSDGSPVGSHDITWVDCILGENQGSGGLLIGQHTKRFSLIRCLMMSNDDRNPYFKGDTTGVVVNCVIYNWGQNPGAYLANPDSLTGATLAAIVGNVFTKGPRSLNHAMQFYANCPAGSMLYVADNSKSDVNGGLPPVDPWSIVNDLFGSDGHATSAPLWPAGLTALPNASVVAAVLDQAGAWASSRDAVDARFVTEYNAGTGQHLQSETYPGGVTLASVGGFPTIAASSRTMEDAGMPADPTTDTDSDGITDLEDWLKSMADDAAGV